MAGKSKGAMRGCGITWQKVVCCLIILMVALALFGVSTTFAVADNAGTIQDVRLSWDPDQNNPEQGVAVNGQGATLTPQSPAVNAAGTAARAKLSFKVENANTEENIQPGELEVRLPAHIFKDREGNWVGTFNLGIPASADDLGEGQTFYYVWDRDADEIVITNGREIADSGQYAFDLTWNSTNAAGDPHAVGDAASGARNIKGDYEKTDIRATATLNHGDVPEVDESDNLSVSYVTSSDFSLTKTAKDYQFNWDDDWGTNPEPDGSYVYTIWEAVVEQTGKGTQPYTLSVADLPQEPAGGEVVYNSFDGGAANVSWTIDPTSADEAGAKTFTYVVRYPVPEDGQGFEASNKTKATMEPLDYAPFDKDDEAKMKIYSLDFKYPGAGPGIEKTSYETHREGAINAINEADKGASPSEIQAFRYNISGSFRGGSLTLAEGADPRTATLEDYGKRAYSVELTDDLLILGNEQLADGDYEIQQITLGDRGETTYEKSEATGGKYASRRLSVAEWCVADEAGKMPTADVYIRYAANSSNYVPYGTVIYGYDESNAAAPLLKNSHFVPAAGMEDAYAVATAGTNGREWYGAARLPLDLPAGVTGVQICWGSKNYATNLTSTILVNLKATDHVKQIVAGQPKLNLTNVNSLRAVDPDGNWYMPSEVSGAEGDLAQIVANRDIAAYGDGGRYAYHATASDMLESYSGHTTIHKGGLASGDDSENNATSTDVSFGYNANTSTYEGLYYVDMADWSALSKVYNGNRMANAVRQKGFVNEQNSGTFYDLLPAGMTVDTSSVKVWEKQLEADESANEGTPAVGKCARSYAWHEANDGATGNAYVHARCNTQVELVQNWQGSGRTMMIVRVSTTDGQNLGFQRFGISNTDEHYYWYSGFHMEFNAYYSRDAFTDYGGSFTNSVAYMGADGSKLWDGYADDASAPNLTDAAYLGDLNGDGNIDATANVVYAQESTQLRSEGASEATPTKRVMDEHDSTWQTETTTTQGGSYRYQLRMVAGDELNDVVVYDDIERHVVTNSITADNPPRWYGTFAGVDASHARRLGIEPVVYYSTRDDLNIYITTLASGNTGTDRDLTRTDIWTPASDYKGNLSDVKAVAVDLSHDADGNLVTIHRNQTVNVYIDMDAPNDPVDCKAYHDGGYRAVNRWIMSSTDAATGTPGLLTIRPVQVRINATVADFAFTKTDSGGRALPGATFALLRWDGDGDAPSPSDGVIDVDNPGGGWTSIGSLTSGDDGVINFEDLVAGTYRLVETAAPSGYERPRGQWQVLVDPTADAGYQVQITEVDDGSSKPAAFALDAQTRALSLTNYRPFELPVSGGWGLVGVIAAAVALVALGALLEIRRRAHR